MGAIKKMRLRVTAGTAVSCLVLTLAVAFAAQEVADADAVVPEEPEELVQEDKSLYGKTGKPPPAAAQKAEEKDWSSRIANSDDKKLLKETHDADVAYGTGTGVGLTKAENVGDDDADHDAHTIDTQEGVHIQHVVKAVAKAKKTKEQKAKAKEKHKKALHNLFLRIERQAEKDVKNGVQRKYAEEHPNSKIAKKLRAAKKAALQAAVALKKKKAEEKKKAKAAFKKAYEGDQKLMHRWSQYSKEPPAAKKAQAKKVQKAKAVVKKAATKKVKKAEKEDSKLQTAMAKDAHIKK